MAKPNDISSARDEARRKIGRNVVNFQKMEGMLKLLNAGCSLSGPVGHLEAIRDQASRKLRKRPMGQLADEFVKSVYAENPNHGVPPPDSKDIWVSFSFTIESDSDLAKERKLALNAVVAERNKLIHQWLADFAPNSIERCERLSALLDEQHEKIVPEYEILVSMVKLLRDVQGEMAQKLAAGEFEK